jgi:hypothetical protein
LESADDPSNGTKSPSNLLSNRRGSQVGREAAAAISAGLNRMLSRGIETISPRIQDQHEADLSSGRVQLTSDSATRKISSRSDKSRKFTTTVRNFGSSVDDDSTHIREPGGSGKENNSGRVVEMNYQREYFEEDEEELETSNYPSPIQDPSPSQSGTAPPPGPSPSSPSCRVLKL